MLTIKYQTAFKTDYKQIKKRGYDIRLLEKAIELAGRGTGAFPGIQRSCTEWRLCRMQGMSCGAGLVTDI